jgi:hypothetical protein
MVVAAAITLTARAAAAQEATVLRPGEHVAPRDALELSVGTGYTQGFGRLASGPGHTVSDVAGPGLGVDGGIGYRLDPYWMVGGVLEYQEFVTGTKPLGATDAMDANSAARGMMIAVQLAYHISPYATFDPWIQVGTGYRALWEVHALPGPTYVYDGFDWLRLTVGADLRVSPDMAIAPVLGVDVNTFLYTTAPTGPDDPFADTRLVFVFAGVMGRVDVLGQRVPR